MASRAKRHSNTSGLPSWKLQDAKARFSALVREARENGPQVVTLHGKDAVVIVAAEEFSKLAGPAAQPSLHTLLSESPFADLDFDPVRFRAPVRDVTL